MIRIENSSKSEADVLSSSIASLLESPSTFWGPAVGTGKAKAAGRPRTARR